MDDNTTHVNRWVAEHSPAHTLAAAARKAGLDRQQVRLLQRAGEDAQDVQDIIDYVKFQAARIAAFRRDFLAQRLLDGLAVTLADAATAFSDRAILPLSIARLFLRQFALSYTYSIVIDNGRPEGAQRATVAPEASASGKETSSRSARHQGRRSPRYREAPTSEAEAAALAEEPSVAVSAPEDQPPPAGPPEPETLAADTPATENEQGEETEPPASNAAPLPMPDVPEEERSE